MFNLSKKTRLERALEAGQRTGENIAFHLRSLGDYPVKSGRDARAICKALANFPFPGQPEDEHVGLDSPLNALLNLMQHPDSREAYYLLRTEGIPQLVRIFKMRDQLNPRDRAGLPYLLKIFALYGDRMGTECIIEAIRQEMDVDHFLWSVALDSFRGGHDETLYLIEQIGENFPVNGFLAVAYLDFLNRAALNGDITEHPYCSDRGMILLRRWLESTDKNRYSYAISAATALPFMTSCERDDLILTGLNHPSAFVRLEAAWAQAKVGDPRGVERLSQLCRDVNYSQQAQAYLKEIGREEAIPAEIGSPDFQAMAEMARWLSHPTEFGKPPDAIELYDTRELYWTPTGDLRQVWLFKYYYQSEKAGEPDEVGIGMVGSITFALFDEATPDLSPEDIYALHCCWELEANNDPRAPQERSVQAGKEILFG